jgi:hypothetical protein
MARGRPRKKQYRQPSIIDSEHEHHFSLSGSDSDSASHESSDSDLAIQEPQPTAVLVPPVLVPQKRTKTGSRKPDTPIPTPIHTINYAVAFFSSAEMKKASSKRVPKSSSFRLRTDEPWDTLKAQLLVKVSDALGNAATLDFSKYNFLVSILRITSKPGLPLATDTDYDLLITKSKAVKVKDSEPILANVTITQLDSGDDKENELGKSKKKVMKDPDTLPGNVEKVNNIQKLQQCWKCDKRQGNCVGMYCYIDREGNHLSLSHQRLDCWASAMVRTN